METFIQETVDRQGNVHQEVLPRSPLHEPLLTIGYSHVWTTKVGNGYSHAYRHPDSLATQSEEIKNNLDSILPGYIYWINQNAQGIDIHNYHKGEAGDAVTLDPNNPQGGHYLTHFYDHAKDT